MSQQPDWKNSATEHVLRLLADHELALSGKSIVYNLSKEMQRPPSRATVYRALRGAQEVGLVHQPDGSLYEITDKGRAYLQGESVEIEDTNQEKHG